MISVDSCRDTSFKSNAQAARWKIKGQTLAEWDWRSRNFVGTDPSAEGVGKVSLG